MIVLLLNKLLGSKISQKKSNNTLLWIKVKQGNIVHHRQSHSKINLSKSDIFKTFPKLIWKKIIIC